MENNFSLKDLLTDNEPITHFFYEHEGPRPVEPLLLIGNAITLWHENVYTNDTHDNAYVWEHARSLVLTPQPTPSHSWVEWLREKITMGLMVPPEWDSRKPFPYKGLFISAVYLHEARRLCEQGESDRAWHIVAMAYYHLGLSTPRSTILNTTKAARLMHAARTEKLRAVVLGTIDAIRQKGVEDSIEGAKNRVVEVLRQIAMKDSEVASWFTEFDAMVSDKVKGRTMAKEKNDVFDRIRNLLDKWALPSGPYPEIAEAFSAFSKRARKPNANNHASRVETTEGIELDHSDYYLRLVHYVGDEFRLTTKLSHSEAP